MFIVVASYQAALTPWISLSLLDGKQLFLHTFQNEPELFRRLCDSQSMETAALAGFLMALKSIVEEGISFRRYVTVLLDFYYDRLNRRNTECYAIGLYDFLTNIPMQHEIRKSLPLYPGFEFLQTRKAFIEYTTMPTPPTKESTLSPSAWFSILSVHFSMWISSGA